MRTGLALSSPRPAATRLCALAGVLVVVVLCALAPSTASAQALACGQVITEDTTLQNDLTGCSGDGIVIGADGLTLDLNGHTVEGSPCDADCAPRNGIDNTAGHDRVRILDGAIRGFERSVALIGAEHNSLAGLTVGGFPVSGPFIGISLSESDDNELGGIVALGGAPAVLLSASDRNRVFDSSIDGGVSIRVGRSLALVDGSDENRVERSRLFGEEGVAIFESAGNRLVHNSIDGGPEAIGLAGARGTRIAANTLTASGFGGTTIVMHADSDENMIRHNSISNGMSIRGDRNRIERNDVQGRFPFVDQSAIAIVSGDANEVLSNRAGGGADDIVVRAGATLTLVQGNVAVDALDDGIDIEASGTVVRGNVANGNGDLGIEAVEGVIDGGGNRASGNGNPLQCLNVVCH